MSAFELRAVGDNLEFGILAGDMVAAEQASSAEAGVLVVAVAVVDGVASVRRMAPGMVVLGRVLLVAGRRG